VSPKHEALGHPCCAEPKALAEDIQREILENYYFVPVFRHTFMTAIGPRIKGDELAGCVPQL
jgi:hypothetical protein